MTKNRKPKTRLEKNGKPRKTPKPKTSVLSVEIPNQNWSNPQNRKSQLPLIKQVICQINHEKCKLRLAQGKQTLRTTSPKGKKLEFNFFFGALCLLLSRQVYLIFTCSYRQSHHTVPTLPVIYVVLKC